MQGTEATFDEVSFEGGDGPRRMLQKLLPAAAAVALAGAVGVWALHLRERAAPEEDHSPLARSALAPTAARPFGDIVIDADLLVQMKQAAPTGASSQMASLEAPPPASYAPIPLPSLDAFPPVPPAPQAGSAPLPPTH